MRRAILLPGVLAALLAAVTAARADAGRFVGERGRHDDRVAGVTFARAGVPRAYHVTRAPNRPSRHARPRRRRRPAPRPAMYSRQSDPAAYWIRYYGGQAYRHGRYLYEPIRTREGVRRYRRIRIRH